MQLKSSLAKTSNKGVAMIAALSLMVVAAGVVAYLFANTMNEIRHSGDSVAIVQSLALARGAANLGNVILNNQVRAEIALIVENNPNSNQFLPFGNGSSTQDPSPQSVISDLKSMVISPVQTKVDSIVCNQDIPLLNSAGTVSLRIHFTDTACGSDLPKKTKLAAGRFISGKLYAIPFVMVASAQVENYKRNIVVQGEYQFDVGGGKFSKYALFTNEHQMKDGTDVWFTDRTLFDGPVHTNQFFRFYDKPWFNGQVSSAGCSDPTTAIASASDPDNINCSDSQGARFFSTNPQFINADDLLAGAPTGTDVPQFQSAVDWKASVIALPNNAFDQKAAAQADGLYFATNLHSLELFAGNASGALPTKSGPNWTPKPTYQYIRSCTAAASCETYRYGSDNQLFQQNTDGTWPSTPLVTNFNGVVYAEGDVDRLHGPERSVASSTDPDDAPPALASFSQLNIVSSNNMRITGDLKYEDPPCSSAPVVETDGSITSAVCNNLNAQNVLGLFTPAGDILIGNQNTADATLNAPDNVEIHGSLMSSQGVVTVENFGTGFGRGNVNLIGGIIENNYGAFGTFQADASGIRSGYGRTFTYDPRMAANIAPPFFPTTSKNEVSTVFVQSFAQREQID